MEKERYEAEKSVVLKNIQRETQDLQAEKEEMQKELAVLKEEVYKTKSAVSYLQCYVIFIKKNICSSI